MPTRVSPRSDAGEIAFVRDGLDYSSIFVMSPDGRGVRRLSAPPPAGSLEPSRRHYQDRPVSSPDGRRLAFVSDRGGSLGIYVMRADGAGTRRVTTSRAGDYAPSWSPDGRRLVFARGPHVGRLYVIDADGRHLRPLTGGALAQDADPAWSPDGQRIAYVTSDGGGFALAIVQADRSAERTLTKGGLDFNPAWSPDGRKVVFSRDATLYMINADGRRLRRLSRTTKTIDDAPSWRAAAR